MVTTTNDAFFAAHCTESLWDRSPIAASPGIGGCLAGQVTHQPGGSFQKEEYGGLTGGPLSSPPEI